MINDPIHGTIHMERQKTSNPMLDARKEVEALGYLTSETAVRVRQQGMDPADLERRLLDGNI
ncbi:hypothetical protein EVC11_030 [Rhizobium phage RHph_I20]|uniref:Uncharacterized protein n=1 Tax=Rhizobium phage RHph_I20 TaxID=2509730 RepID=A0A7S5RBJ6_9CAUD|nr:hypothetical protein EVC11_030 [Rhizobium phage RHph_I20]